MGLVKTELEQDFTLDEVATALRMSTRWVRDRIRLDGVEYIRRGRGIYFTAAQVAALRAMHIRSLAQEPVTTGPDRRRTS